MRDALGPKLELRAKALGLRPMGAWTLLLSVCGLNQMDLKAQIGGLMWAELGG